MQHAKYTLLFFFISFTFLTKAQNTQPATNNDTSEIKISFEKKTDLTILKGTDSWKRRNPTIGFNDIESGSPYSCDANFKLIAYSYSKAKGYITPGFSAYITTDSKTNTENYISFYIDDHFVQLFDIGTFSGLSRFYGEYLDPDGVWWLEWCDIVPDGTFPYIVYDHADWSLKTSGTMNHNDGDTCNQIVIGKLNGIAVFSGSGVTDYSNGTGWFDAGSAGTGTHTITYFWDNEAGFSGSASQTITVMPPPVANAGADVNICKNDAVQIGGSPSATSGDGNYSYKWTPTKGLSSSLVANPVASPSETTTYTLKVTDNDGSGCSDTDEITVSVSGELTASIPFDTITLCNMTEKQLSVTIVNDCGTITSRYWSGDTGFLSDINSATPAFSADTAGTFNLYFTVENSEGCSATDSLVIKVMPLPEIELTNDTAICRGDSLTLQVNSGYSSYLWQDGSADSSFCSDIAGTFWVKVTDINGCSASDEINLSVIELPEVNLGNDTALCVGMSVTFDAGYNSNYSYCWQNTSLFHSISADTAGLYHVTVTEINGCQSSDSVTLTINSLPEISLGNDTAVCCGETVEINPNGQFAAYLWQDNSTDSLFVCSASGTYYLDVTDDNGCNNSDTVEVTVYPLPVFTLGNDTSVCSGQSVIFSPDAAFESYLWQNGDTSPRLKADTAAIYWVEVTDVNGCSNIDSVELLINALPVVSLGKDISIYPGESATLDAGTGFFSYLWNNSSVAQTIQVSDAGDYWVEVTDANGCSNSDEITVKIKGTPEIGFYDITAASPYNCSDTIILKAYSYEDADGFIVPGFAVEAYRDELTGSYNNLAINNAGVVTDQLTNASLLSADTSLLVKQYLSGTGNWSVRFKTTGNYTELPFETEHSNWNIIFNDNTTTSGDTMIVYRQIDNDFGTAVFSGSGVTDNGNGTALFIASGAGTGTHTISYCWDNNAGFSGCSEQTITVESPFADAGTDVNICAGDSILVGGNPSASGGAGNYNYNWQPADGLSSDTLSNPYAKPGQTTSYILTVTDNYGKGCQAVDTVIITVFDNPSVDLPDQTIQLCAYSVFSFNPVISDGTNPVASYHWKGNTSNLTELSLPSTSFTSETAGLYSFSLVISDAYGCYAADSVIIKVNTTPEIFLGNDTAVCFGESVTFDAGIQASYKWHDLSTSRFFTSYTAGIFHVDVTNAEKCTNSDTIRLEINSLPEFDLGNDTAVCKGDTAILTSGLENVSYSWSTGSIEDTIKTTVAGKYWAVITDLNNCSYKDSIEISINKLPEVFIGNDTAICQGETVVFTATPGYSYYYWQDGSTGENYTALSGGIYHVEVTDENSCRNSDSATLNLKPLPDFDLGNDTAFCYGNSIEFDAGSGFMSYLWQNNTTNQSIVTDSPGTYYVKVTAYNECSKTDTIRLAVYELPVFSLGNDTAVCYGESLTLTTGSNYKTYQWQDNSGSPTYTANTTGKYYVTVTDLNNCQYSDSLNLTVNSLPVVNLGNDTAICHGASITFDAGERSAYLWQDESVNRTITVNTAGIYKVTVTNEYNCTKSDSVQLSINPLPRPDIGNDTAICYGYSITFDAGTGYATYQWNDYSANSYLTVSMEGTYSVKVTDNNGCEGSDTVQLVVNPLPVFTLGNDTSICSGETITFSPDHTYIKYLWQDSSQNNNLTTDTAGTYYVTVTDENVCSSTDTMILQINPVPVVQLRNDTAICDGDSLELEAPANYPEYLWNTGSVKQIIIARQAGTYSVEVTNQYNCTTSESVQLSIYELPVVTLQNDTAICLGDEITFDAGNGFNTYLWNDSSTSQTITTDTAGIYILKITDFNNCRASDSVVLQIFPLPVTDLGNDTSICEGDKTILNAGSGFEMYKWYNSSGEITDVYNQTVITIQSEDTYSVEVTDENQCTSSDSMYLKVMPEIIINSVQKNDISCFGSNDGSILVNSSGISPDILFSIDGGETFYANSGEFTELVEGIYQVIIQNSNGCITTGDTIQISEPMELSISITQTDVNCYDSNDGMVAITASNGTPGYLFLLQDDSIRTKTTAIFSELYKGEYNLIVSDTNNCAKDTTVVIGYPLELLITDVEKENISCNNLNDATITITAEGGTGKIMYSIDAGSNYLDNSGFYTNLDEGKYQAAVTDEAGCITIGDTLSINNPEIIVIDTVYVTPTSCFYMNDGEIEIEVTGGTTPYNFVLNDSIYSESEIITGLTPGYIRILVTDSNSCETTDTAFIPRDESLCVEIPQVFTPNGDGYNDLWEIENIDIFPNLVIEVYDRWSKVIYKSSGYYEPWDGTTDGRSLPENSYFYIIYLDKSVKPIMGTVTIIR